MHLRQSFGAFGLVLASAITALAGYKLSPDGSWVSTPGGSFTVSSGGNKITWWDGRTYTWDPYFQAYFSTAPVKCIEFYYKSGTTYNWAMGDYVGDPDPLLGIAEEP